MHEFAVWAPRAEKVSLVLENVRHVMQQSTGGWWRVALDVSSQGTAYGFAVDDDEAAYPDPRSPWQPEGVHALSRTYDHARYTWQDAGWNAQPLASAVIYEMHPGTFTKEGTLDGAIGKLPYLRGLGITHVELMPMASFDGKFGWGYDGVALYAPQESYGGPDALKRFVDACHGQGMAVLLDVVYNHFGPVGNYTGKFGPYILTDHHTPWGGVVNLEDWGSGEVRQFLCDNALMWMRDYHIDGLRLDAIHALLDRSAIHFLEQLSAEVEQLSTQVGRNLVLIAESDLNDPRVMAPREAGGMGMDAQWSDDFHHALFSLLTGEREGYYRDFGGMDCLAKALQHAYVFDGVYSEYRGRVQGKSVGAMSAHKFLGYIQNHDQVGNRAIGDRVHAIAGMAKAKIAAAVVLMAPFVPMLFQGEEFAADAPFLYFADHDDPAMAKAVAEGRRGEFASFGWKPEEIPNPSEHATFAMSKIPWKQLEQSEHAEMHAWYRDLIALRRSEASLADGVLAHVKVHFDEGQGWFVFERGEIAVICNLSESMRRVDVRGEVLLKSVEGVAVDEKGVVLLGQSVAILRRLHA